MIANHRTIGIILSVALSTGLTHTKAAAAVPEPVAKFLESHCAACHSGSDAEGALNWESLSADVQHQPVAEKWLRMLARVKAAEMPPPDDGKLTPQQIHSFEESLSRWIVDKQRQRHAAVGRVVQRRLTNVQLERSLQDLLGIDTPLAEQMTQEPRQDGFTTVASIQSFSHFELEQHLRVVDAALDEAWRRALTPPDDSSTKLEAKQIARENSRRRCREPEMLDGRAVVWNSRLIFYGRLPCTTAKADGWYRLTLNAQGLKPPKDSDVWCTIRTGRCVSSAPLLNMVDSFEATPEPQTVVVEAFLHAGEMFEVRPGDATLNVAKFAGGQVGAGEGGPQNVPGVAINWLKIERFNRNCDDDKTRKRLFGELPITPQKNPQKVSVKVDNPGQEITRRVAHMARRAFRRPVPTEDLKPFIDIAMERYKQSNNLLDALRSGYRAVLCSPRFLYIQESPGRLDDYQIATRLSYLLQGTTPDWELMRLASEGGLQKREAIIKQAKRLLGGEKGRQFVVDFANQWLDLSEIGFTEPDRKLYPGFDPIVQQSMLKETQQYLLDMLRSDASVARLIDSEYTFLNSRLARYYKVPGVTSGSLQRVALQPASHRGGLLTQGAIMKVTANGTTTSPVIRGVWVSERLLGRAIPPPPENVPAIEPDVRGAKTIREMLAKHVADAACASCHRMIDPPGFALENFDPSGRWRTSYGDNRSRNKKKTEVPIDASFVMPEGQKFSDLEGFKKLALKDKDRLAKNVVEKLLIYGTGAPACYADLEAIQEIVEQAKDKDYGFQSLLLATVASEVFRNK